MNKMLISKVVPAEQLSNQFKGDLSVTPDTLLRVTVEIADQNLQPRLSKEDYLATIHDIMDRLIALPLKDDRPLEDMLYDEHGLLK